MRTAATKSRSHVRRPRPMDIDDRLVLRCVRHMQMWTGSVEAGYAKRGGGEDERTWEVVLGEPSALWTGDATRTDE